jgi:hypothetical protein
MSKHKKIIGMSVALVPFVALSCWLISAGYTIAGDIVFCLVVIFGNWFVWYNMFRKSKVNKVRE